MQGDMYVMTWVNKSGLTMKKDTYKHYNERISILLSLVNDIEKHCKRRMR